MPDPGKDQLPDEEPVSRTQPAPQAPIDLFRAYARNVLQPLQGLNVRARVFLYRHITREDGRRMEAELPKADIVAIELHGWVPDMQIAYQKVSDGEMEPQQALSWLWKRNIGFEFQEHALGQLEALHNCKKPILFLDVPQHDKNKKTHVPYFFPYANKPAPGQDTILHRLHETRKGKADHVLLRRDAQVLGALPRAVADVLASHPELHAKEQREGITILFPIGAAHGSLAHGLRAGGIPVTSHVGGPTRTQAFDIDLETSRRYMHGKDVPELLLKRNWLLEYLESMEQREAELGSTRTPDDLARRLPDDAVERAWEYRTDYNSVSEVSAIIREALAQENPGDQAV
jgi:hypothetical protein